MKNRPIFNLLQHLFSLILTGFFLLPLLWMIAASLRTPGLPLPRELELLPSAPSFENYIRIFEIIPIGQYLFNSFTVTLSGVLLTLVTASWAGFGMALLGKHTRLRLLLLSAILQMIPATAFWLTRFLFLSRLGLTNSHFALILPALMGTSSLFILLFYWTFRRIDRAVFESAEMDGADLFQTWWQIALPLARPALMAVGMLAFLFYWNDFLNPLLYLHSQTLYTLPVGLLQLQEMDRTNWSLLMAASVMTSLPALIIFFSLQRSLLNWDAE